MTSKYLKYHIKGTLFHPSMLGWGIGLTILWVFLGAFVFSTGFTKTLEHTPIEAHHTAILYYTSGWFSSLTLYSFSSLTMGLAFTLFYSTSSVTYALKFTRLSPVKYHVYNILSSLLMFLLLSSSTVTSVYGLYSYSFGKDLCPRNMPLLMIASLFAGVFLYLFSMLLTLSCIALGRPRLAMTLAYAPVVFSIVFSYAQLYAYFSGIETILHISPFSNIISLLAHAYSGMDIPLTFTNPQTDFINIGASTLSLLFWTAALGLVDVYLIKKVKAVPPREFF